MRSAGLHFLMGAAIAFMAPIIHAEDEDGSGAIPPPPPASSSGLGSQDNPQTPVVFEKAKPVVINGKPAEEMNDDEIQEFLQSKVRDIYQGQSQVQIIRVAPGYPVTLDFDESVGDPIIGDPDLIGTKTMGKILVVTAKQRAGDTSMVVPLSGNRLYPYHVFVAKNFLSTDTLLKVHFTDGDTSSSSAGSSNGRPAPDLAQIAAIVGNYDALKQEKSLDVRDVKRVPVRHKSVFGTFEYYDWYLFADGTAVLSFAITAREGPIKAKSSRIRLQIGNERFVPQMVSINEDVIPSGSAGTGFVVFRNPPFESTQPLKIIDQPFELVFQ